MFNVTRTDGSDHKDPGHDRIKRHEQDILWLVAQFERYNLSRKITDLMLQLVM